MALKAERLSSEAIKVTLHDGIGRHMHPSEAVELRDNLTKALGALTPARAMYQGMVDQARENAKHVGRSAEDELLRIVAETLCDLIVRLRTNQLIA